MPVKEKVGVAFVGIHTNIKIVRRKRRFRFGITIQRVVNRYNISVVRYSVFEIIGAIAENIEVFYSFARVGSVEVNIFDEISNRGYVLFAGREFLVNIFQVDHFHV